MPSPLGHALAGLSIGLIAAPPATTPGRKFAYYGVPALALAGALVAASPDLDLIYPPAHRTVTHSVGALALIMIVTAAVTGKVTGRIDWRWVWGLGAAYASHMLLDWLGTDKLIPSGIQLLWPFSRRYFLSGWDIFPPVERRLFNEEGVWTDVRAGTFELVVMGTIATLVWIATRARRAPRPPGSR